MKTRFYSTRCYKSCCRGWLRCLSRCLATHLESFMSWSPPTWSWQRIVRKSLLFARIPASNFARFDMAAANSSSTPLLQQKKKLHN
ncbi:hypothetical protein L3X38_024315 [Prunus dulcis]|uniref:Uncharacterized protein n=1 Tax=Prunus dulcis TaxID=3755 RepID=A0AAD4W1I6_PRUDU|nr:hypothetical protein L3X38_024315 [Prunus dulcis]